MFNNFDITKAGEKLLEKLSAWGEAAVLKIPNFLMAIVVFIIFWFIGKYTSKLISKYLLNRKGQESIKMIIARTTFIVIVIIGFFISLGILDLDKVLTSVLAGAGVIGLAIGLALQGTLNNTFSGVILSFLPNIQIGDWIESNDYSGRVVDINLRSVVIIQPDNNLVLIPNSKIVDSPFTNYSRTKRARIILSVGVGYESDLESVKEITLNAVAEKFEQKNNEVLELFYTEFGDSSINFVVRFWVDAVDQREMAAAKSIAILAIKKAYNEHNINIPFPIRTLDFGKNKFRSETLTVKNQED